MKRLSFFIAALIIVGAGAGATWYLSSRTNQIDIKNKPSVAEGQTLNNGSSSSSTSQNNQKSNSYPVLVYFSKHPDSDNDPSQTFPVSRTSSDLGVASFSISQLLKGPTATESSQNYFTTARLRGGTGTNDFKLTITSGVATLQFLKPFDHLGVVADGQADSEIKATLKQFSNITKVIILNYQGNCEFDLSGQNLCKQ